MFAAVHQTQMAPTRTISMKTRYNTVSIPIADHPNWTRRSRRIHSAALTANQMIPAADVGTEVPAITA